MTYGEFAALELIPPLHPNCGCELAAGLPVAGGNYGGLPPMMYAASAVDPFMRLPNETELDWLIRLGRGEYYVTKSQMIILDWTSITNDSVRELNWMLMKYGITALESITLFLATCSAETDYGWLTLEEGSDAYFTDHGYSRNTRGVGYMQTTSRDTHLSFLNYMGDSFTGTDTAGYIDKNYSPWEVAAWDWAVSNYGNGVIMNDYVNQYGASLNVYLVTQYFVNSWPKAKPGDNESPDAVLRSIREGKSSWEVRNGRLIVNGVDKYAAPNGWGNRTQSFNKATGVFLEER